ncbi:hypothetical protein [Rubinisphaera margarita]|uniref:hypothetical protein n=1 Tax=Rubinisphaera margarita TaxID=2909586 RepID=UPI001EE90918|nr:hypothetical protein [Rubinisphaera margarita]MCG6157733.1 hypothetical protein [Rubinisphaera margarita]
MYKTILSTILTGTLMAVGPQLSEADAGNRNWSRNHYGHRHYDRGWDRGHRNYRNRDWNDWNRRQYRGYRYYGNRNYNRGYPYGNRGYYRGYNNSPRFGFYYSF